MYRLSVTTVEKFRRYIKSLSARDNEEELIQSIKGIFKGNEMTVVGEAYHKIIEGEAIVLDNGLLVELERDGAITRFFFTPEQVEPALAFRDRHPHMIHEIPVSKVYQTKYGPIELRGRVDGQEGLETEDKKCKFSPVHDQDYIDSFQWRYYLDMLVTDTFFYDVFEVRGYQGIVSGPYDPETGPIYQIPGASFHAHDRIPCHRYAYLGYDCLTMLNDFLDYIELRQLWNFLKKSEVPVC